MTTRFLTTVLGLAVVAIPAVASQPEVRLSDLRPASEATLSDADFAVLLADPRAAQELSMVLPAGFTVLDVDADPFAI